MKKTTMKQAPAVDPKELAPGGLADLMQTVKGVYNMIEKAASDARFAYYLDQDSDEVWVVVDRRNNTRTRYAANDSGRLDAMDFIVMNQCLSSKKID